MGITLLKLGQLDEAIFILKKTVYLNCKYPEANNNLGNALRKKGMFEESKYYLLKAIEFRPNYSSAFNNLGLLYMQTGLIKDAEKYFIKAVLKDKKNAEAFNNLGIVLQETGKLKDAINRINKRLGPQRTKEALDAIEKKEWSKACKAMLDYYDRCYDYELEKSKNINSVDLSGLSLESSLVKIYKMNLYPL